MANMNLVTGYAGTAHVTAEDAGAYHAASVGAGQYVMDIGNKLAASAVTNNQVRVLDGEILMQGRHVRIAQGSYVDLAIDNGATGQNRNDLIVARYTKNASSGVEEVNLVVIKGTASGGAAVDPSYTSGNILGGSMQNDMPLYRVRLNGINIQSLDCLFNVIVSMTGHENNKNNPHGVTAAQTGAKVAGAVETIANGGTGSTTAAAARTALGITPANIGAAASGHTHVKSQITDFPSSMPASDVYTWAKASSKPAYNASEVGAAAATHNHDVSQINGTMPVSKGGTGVTSIAALKTALGVASYSYDASTQTLSITL